LPKNLFKNPNFFPAFNQINDCLANTQQSKQCQKKEKHLRGNYTILFKNKELFLSDTMLDCFDGHFDYIAISGWKP
jgi:hypothetical protein